MRANFRKIRLYLSLLVLGTILFISFIRGRHSPLNTNVLIIVVDTVRSDHTSVHGYDLRTTPNLEVLAQKSTTFDHAFTVINRTTPAALSLVTGLYPHSHGLRELIQQATPRSLTTLAEVLAAAGFETAAFVHQHLLLQTSPFAQGFSTYRNAEGKDEEVHTWARNWLRRRPYSKKPWFLLVWYFAPHYKYIPPYQDLSAFVDIPPDELLALNDKGWDTNERAFGLVFDEQESEIMKRAYDGEIHYADRLIGELLESLKESRQFDSTMIVVTSDHGESLGEHGIYFEHGEYLYDEDLRIPLVIKRPHQQEAENLSRPAAITDIFATVLGQLGLHASSEGIDLFQPEAPSRALFAESDLSLHSNNKRRYIRGIAGKWRAARRDSHKLIWIPHPEQQIFEFYDTARDPGETENRMGDPAYANAIDALKKELSAWQRQGLASGEPTAADQDFDGNEDPDFARRLRSLGYLR